MLRLKNRIREILYDGKPLPRRRFIRWERWDPHAIISDELYEINLRYLVYAYELSKRTGKPHDSMPRETLLEGVRELCEHDPEIRDAEQLKKIQSLADVWD